MKLLTVEEAVSGLDHLMDLALAGEQIQIRKGNAIVELRPTPPNVKVDNQQLTPREALRRLQLGAQLSRQQAEAYLQEVRLERLASKG